MRTEIRLALSILLLAIVTRSTILLIDYMVNRPAVLSIVNDSNWYNILLIEVSLFKINSSFLILCTILVIDRKLRKRAAFINIIRSWTKYRTVLLLAGGFGIGILLRTLFFIINGELPVSSRVCWTMISLLFKYPIYVLFPYCFVIAVAEESLWRGCFTNLMRQSWGMGKALFFGSLMFAFWHFTGTITPDIPHIVDLTTGGFFLTAAYFCTDSLALPIGLHWGSTFSVQQWAAIPSSESRV